MMSRDSVGDGGGGGGGGSGGRDFVRGNKFGNVAGVYRVVNLINELITKDVIKCLF